VLRHGQYHEVYEMAAWIMDHCLDAADRESPEIVPELEAKVASLDPHGQQASGFVDG
jgi:hypothetical protein